MPPFLHCENGGFFIPVNQKRRSMIFAASLNVSHYCYVEKSCFIHYIRECNECATKAVVDNCSYCLSDMVARVCMLCEGWGMYLS